MGFIIAIFGGLLPLAFLGLIIWGVATAVGHRNDGDSSGRPEASARRAIVTSLLFVALMAATFGALKLLTLVGDALSSIGRTDASALAGALSLLIVGVPSFIGLLIFVRRKLVSDPNERRALSWSVYLNLVLLVSLSAWLINAYRLLETTLGLDTFDRDVAGPVAAVIVWAAVWAVHWFWLRAEHGIRGTLHLLLGAAIGLYLFAAGLYGLAATALSALYEAVIVDVLVEGSSVGPWIPPLVLGAVTWVWHWLGHFRRAERSTAWNVYVVLLASLTSFVALIIAAGTMLFVVLQWVFDTAEDPAAVHFNLLPGAVAASLVATLMWRYHRGELHADRRPDRTDPIRIYDYLIAGASLVTALGGFVVLLVVFQEALAGGSLTEDRNDLYNLLIGAGTSLLIGVPLWWTFWSRINTYVVRGQSRIDELVSPVRRIYLFGLFGLGGLVVGFSLITAMFFGLEALLDGSFGREAVLDMATPLALIFTVGLATWYHFAIFWAERGEIPERESGHATMTPTAPVATLPPPPSSSSVQLPPPVPQAAPSAPAGVIRRIAVLALEPAELVKSLGALVDADVVGLRRTDDMPGPVERPAIDLAVVVAQLAERADEDALVIVGSAGISVVHYTTG